MNDLERIEHALAEVALSHQIFERCAQDILVGIFPGLVPIPGGTDWGRDADVVGTDEAIPPRLFATTARTLDGVRSNMLAGIGSMNDHGVPIGQVILANPANLSLLQRQRLVESAARKGVRLEVSNVFDRGFFGSRLRRDGYWRNELLGLSSEPITLSPVPTELAESPYAFLPLVARAEDVAAIEGNDDLIVTGPPGVGKSRVLKEIAGVAFVDRDAGFEQIASDIRWATPTAVVVDDAAQRLQQLRRLAWLRSTERDVMRYRIIAACWPDDVPAVSDALPRARVHEIQLLERADLNEILLAMGVTRQIARAEILAQSEGRPGWLVALADLLLRAGDPKSLLSGKALYGEVARFLRRANLGDTTIDILATIAALGGVEDDELTKLARSCDMDRPIIVQHLSAAARSGLVDITSRYDWSSARSVRRYSVRPPMLARVLVAERAYLTDIPAVDLAALVEEWPEGLGSITESTIIAAQLGADAARGHAGNLFDRLMADSDVPHEEVMRASRALVRTDQHGAEHVLRFARAAFDELIGAGDFEPSKLQPVSSLAALIARGYGDPGAVKLLLDAAAVDQRETNPYPDHPLRLLTDLIQDFHPEIPLPLEIRYRVADAFEGWAVGAPQDLAHQRVIGALLGSLFSFRLRSAQSDPGSPMSLQLIETVLPPDGMRRVLDQLWPLAERLLQSNNPHVAKELIDAAAAWLRIGGGYDRPFGRSHPDESIAAARELGEALVGRLASVPLSRGAKVHLRSTAEWFDVTDVEVALGDEEPFFRDLDRRLDDWRSAESQLVDDVKAVAETWASDPPADVAGRLSELKNEIEEAQLMWPGRVWIAALKLAETVAEPEAWISAFVAADLASEAGAFVRPGLQQGRLTASHLAELAQVPGLHYTVLEASLAFGGSEGLDVVVQNLHVSDYGLVQTLALRGQLSPDILRRLLTETPTQVRSMVALAFFYSRRGEDEDWSPEPAEGEWLEALLQWRPREVPAAEYETVDLLAYLASTYPDTLRDIVISLIEGDAGSGLYQGLPHGGWEVLSRLPQAHRLEIWQRFTDPRVAWFLRDHLIGADAQWAGELIDAGELDIADAVSCFGGLGPRPSLEDLAAVLVPRGADPAAVAGILHAGSWSGEESARYEGLVELCRGLMSSDDENVQAVGRAGVKMFERSRDAALERERLERIRGR